MDGQRVQLNEFWRTRLYPSAQAQYESARLHIFGQPEGHSPNAIKEWLQAIIRIYDFTPTALAKEAGLAPTTITRFLSGHSVNKSISATTINAIVSALARNSSRRREDASTRSDGSKASEVSIPICGKVAADQYVQNPEIHPFDQQYIIVPMPRAYVDAGLAALEMSDDSACDVFPRKAILIISPLFTQDGRLLATVVPDGTRVILQKRNSEDLIETTVWESRKLGDGGTLLTSLCSGQVQNALVINSRHDNDQKMVISHHVVASFALQPAVLEGLGLLPTGSQGALIRSSGAK